MKKLLEQVDVVWINLKLAEISRKHGMPNLAEYYQTLSANFLPKEGSTTAGGSSSSGEAYKLEQFKQVYERFKLKMTYCSEEVTQHECLQTTMKQA